MFFRKKKTEPEKISNSNNELLEVVRTDRNGNKYYQFKDAKQMPGERYLVGLVKVEEANMGVDAEDLYNYLTDALDNFNKSKFAEAASTLVKLRNRVVTADPKNAYLSLAGVYILLNDESPQKYDVVAARRKYKLWTADPDLQSFFLNFAYGIIKSYQPTYSGAIRDVSNIVQQGKTEAFTVPEKNSQQEQSKSTS